MSDRENLVGGNTQSSDGTDEFLLQTLRTCRLEVLADRGLDETLGVLSDGQKQVRSDQISQPSFPLLCGIVVLASFFFLAALLRRSCTGPAAEDPGARRGHRRPRRRVGKRAPARDR